MTRSFYVLILCLTSISTSNSFNFPFPSLNSKSTKYTYSLVETESEVLELAEFRAGRTVEELVQSQVDKSKGFDASASSRFKSVLEGVGAGLLVGLLLSGLEFGSGSDGNSSGLLVGTLSGSLIGLNNLLGKRIYIMKPSEATNRLIQDYASGINSGIILRNNGNKLKGDRSFAVRDGGKVIGCLDFIYRNPRGTELNFEHIHLKNMMVKENYRRNGIGGKLLDSAFKFVKDEYKVESISLEVDDDNFKAIGLYKKKGFRKPESIGGIKAKGKYGIFFIGRSIMIKK
ncbi:hypothetical protein TrLO_g296 [Triparma laevis f. longispina]|uniref:N-acetyltransferase domain-containing protein n=1 Tax=Triparma laevis f. longispina TaxID=1714387 RepID=A0A9W7FMT3_9STRA|nr:hypothetical protein TrLO_g296 [Triparma laevis f. longispina]